MDGTQMIQILRINPDLFSENRHNLCHLFRIAPLVETIAGLWRGEGGEWGDYLRFSLWVDAKLKRTFRFSFIISTFVSKLTSLRFKEKPRIHGVSFNLRRVGDSNPRDPFGYTRFPGVLLKPLGQLSYKFAPDDFIQTGAQR